MATGGGERLVTRESVFAACAAIQVSGKAPSYRSIISWLGGGSPNDVKEHFAEWRRLQTERTTQSNVVPERIPELEVLAERLIDGLRNEVGRLIISQRTRFEEKLRGAEAAYDEGRRLHEEATARLQEEHSKNMAAAHQAEADALDEAEKLRAACEAADVRAGRAEAEVDRLARELSEVRMLLAESERARDATAERLARAETVRHQAEREREALSVALERLTLALAPSAAEVK